MTDDEYEKAVDEMIGAAVDRFRLARGKEKALELAIEQYLDDGESLEIGPYELHDYFHISIPGLLEKAGYPASELEAGSALFNKVCKSRYEDQSGDDSPRSPG